MVEPFANSTPPVDCGLRCPSCGYNLTGIAEPDHEHRCPECGRAFEVEELLKVPDPIPWEDHRRSLAIRFLRTCWMTWVEPAEFGRQFPSHYRAGSARSFRWMVAVIIAVFATGTLAPALMPARVSGAAAAPAMPWWEPICLVVVGLLATVWGCEAAIVLVLSAVLPRPQLSGEAVSRGFSSSWAGLVGYYRSFLFISLVGGVLAAILGARTSHSSGPMWIVSGVACWWWFALDTAVAAHCGFGSRRTIATFAIPFIGLVSILGALFVAVSVAACL